MKLDPIEGEYKEPLHKNKEKASTKEYTKIVCPNCSNSIKAENINLGDRLAKCGSCDIVFSVQNELNNLLNPAPIPETPKVKPNKKSKPVVGNQVDIDVYEYAGELSIDIVDYTDWIALISGLISMPLIPIGVGLLHDKGSAIPLIIGVALFIIAILKFIKYRENKSFIDVDDTYLRISSSQKYIYRKKEYLRSNIRQFYTKSNMNSPFYFNVFMIYDGPEGEEHIKISPMTKSRSRALYIEQSLESFIGIKDEIVAEETGFE